MLNYPIDFWVPAKLNLLIERPIDMINKVMLSGFLTCFLAAAGAVAQEILPLASRQGALTLFENIEVNESRPTTPDQPSRESRATTLEPVFTLVGTSRIGDRRSAILRHQNGENIRVLTGLKSTTRIAGYEEYLVLEVGAGKLSVRYPKDVPCAEHKDKGVSCSTTPNTALLELVNAEALARTEPISNAAGSSDSKPELAGSGTAGATSNPFEALRAARAAGLNTNQNSANENGDVSNGRFTPRRIAPEDVPSGMRVVSTPFGDRLVEE